MGVGEVVAEVEVVEAAEGVVVEPKARAEARARELGRIRIRPAEATIIGSGDMTRRWLGRERHQREEASPT